MRMRGVFVLLLAAALLLTAALLGGCASSDGNVTKGSASTDSAKQPVTHSYDTMPLDAHAETALTFMPKTIEDHISRKIEDGAVEGEAYVDVRGIEPVFVGYEVVAWQSGSGEVEYVEVPYLNGHIATALASPETEETNAPEVDSYDAMNVRQMPDSPSAGEMAAVDAARAKLGELFPDRKWEYGIKQYLFLYSKDGTGMVMGTTLDGELGIYSSAVTLAE